jgi:hypothetical protein
LKLDTSKAITFYPDAKGVIYTIVNLITGKKYNGKTVELKERLYKYRSRHKAYQRAGLVVGGIYGAFAKYGIENFEMRAIFMGIPEELLSDFEVWRIAHEDTFNNGYNLTLGGEGVSGYRFTDEQLLALLTQPIKSNNTSGFKGVSFHKGTGKWQARITFNEVEYPLGYFDTAEEAAAARQKALENFLLHHELPPKRQASEYRHVRFEASKNTKNKWRACCYSNGKHVSLGYWKTELEAAAAVAEYLGCEIDDLLTKRALKAREKGTRYLHTPKVAEIVSTLNLQAQTT